MSHAERTESCE